MKGRVFSLSFKGNSYLRVFSLNYFYWVFITSVFTLPSKDEDEEADHETKADPGRLDQMVHPMAERLDILLSLLLSYIKDVCYVDGNSLQKSQLWCTVLGILMENHDKNPCFEYEEKKV